MKRKSKLPLILFLFFLLFSLCLLTFVLWLQYSKPEKERFVSEYQAYESLYEKDALLQKGGESLFLEAEDFRAESLVDAQNENQVYIPSLSKHALKVWKERNLKFPLLTVEETKKQIREKSLAYKFSLQVGLEEAQKIFSQQALPFPDEENLQKPLNKMFVFLDAGHGGKDVGALSPTDNLQVPTFPEKQSNLLLTALVKTKLEALGAEVFSLREEDVFVSLGARSAKVAEKSLLHFQETLEKEISYRSSFAVSNENTQAIAYFSEILKVLKEETIPFYQKHFQEIYEKNEDQARSLFGGYGASKEARLLYDIQKHLKNTIFLSLHANASLQTQDKGTQAYFLTNQFIFEALDDVLPEGYQEAQTYAQSLTEEKEKVFYPQYLHFSSQGRTALAYHLYRSVSETLPELSSEENKRILQLYFFVLRTMGYDAVLYESAYMSNEEDFSLLQKTEKRENLAQALVHGLIDALTFQAEEVE